MSNANKIPDFNGRSKSEDAQEQTPAKIEAAKFIEESIKIAIEEVFGDQNTKISCQ